MRNPMDKELKCRAQQKPWNAGIDILLLNNESAVTNLEWSMVDEGSMVEPTFSLGHTEAQLLMDDLWNAGIRPSEGSGSTGQLRATEHHLNDMRKIVGKWMKLEL